MNTLASGQKKEAKASCITCFHSASSEICPCPMHVSVFSDRFCNQKFVVIGMRLRLVREVEKLSSIVARLYDYLLCICDQRHFMYV